MRGNRNQNTAATYFHVLKFVVLHAPTPMLFGRRFVSERHAVAGRVIEVNVRCERYTADIRIRLRSIGSVVHPDVNSAGIVRLCGNSVGDAIPGRKEDWATIKSELC